MHFVGLPSRSWKITHSPQPTPVCSNVCAPTQNYGLVGRPATTPNLQLRKLLFGVELLYNLPKIILTHIYDPDFALGIFFRIAGVRGVDHDRLPEFPAN